MKLWRAGVIDARFLWIREDLSAAFMDALLLHAEGPCVGRESGVRLLQRLLSNAQSTRILWTQLAFAAKSRSWQPRRRKICPELTSTLTQLHIVSTSRLARWLSPLVDDPISAPFLMLFGSCSYMIAPSAPAGSGSHILGNAPLPPSSYQDDRGDDRP